MGDDMIELAILLQDIYTSIFGARPDIPAFIIHQR